MCRIKSTTRELQQKQTTLKGKPKTTESNSNKMVKLLKVEVIINGQFFFWPEEILLTQFIKLTHMFLEHVKIESSIKNNCKN
jgi:hypothetical protein